MSNWWKRFFGLDNDDDDERLETGRDYLNEPYNVKTPPQKAIGRFEDPGRRIEVKMVNQFPTTEARNRYEHKSVDANVIHRGQLQKNRHFDALDEPAYLRKTQQNIQHQSYNEKRFDDTKTRSNRSPRHTVEERGEDNQEKKKKPFRPTTVPSPIFGYQQRREYPKPIVEEKIAPTHELDEKDDLFTDEVAVTKVEEEQVPNQWNDGFTETNTYEVTELEASEDELDGAPFEEEIPVEQEKVNPLDTTTRDHSVEHKNPAVPYNVLMFGVDRHALRKNQEQQNQKLSSNRFPGNQMSNLRENSSTGGNGQRDARFMESKPSAHQTIPKEASVSTEKRSLQINLFQDPPQNLTDDFVWINEKREVLKQVLKNFHVHADIVSYVQGPTVTRFEIHLHPGVKVSKVIGLTEDIKLSMAAEQIRIAPVSGKSTVGIEIPNEKRKPVYLKTLLQSDSFKESTAPLTAALGIDISGKEVVTDLSKMPHGLIAGATGSGKSVCIHSLILSLIYKSNPEQLRLVLIDPKVVELAVYQRLPHLAAPVINQPKDAALALRWAVEEMERRYQAFAEIGVRDIKKYNQSVPQEEKWPYIVIIIDELADLMMVSPHDVEESICRIAQKARAAGIHLLLATQRPSVDVITGLIKANIPTRIAFGVSSQADSRTILDSGGAERLLGQGDMLFAENGSRDIQRLQGAFVSDDEIDSVTDYLMSWPTLPYLFDPVELREQRQTMDDEDDELYAEAANFVIEQGQASVSSLQRRFRIGYNRAARLIDSLEANDVISEANGSKPRQVLMTKEMFSGNE